MAHGVPRFLCLCNIRSVVGGVMFLYTPSVRVDNGRPTNERTSKGAATFQKLRVSIFPSHPYKRATTVVKAVEGGWKRCPPPSRLWGQGPGAWENVVSSSGSLGRNRSRKRFLGVSCAFRLFMRFRVIFSAFNSCLEMGYSNIPLLAGRSDIPC